MRNLNNKGQIKEPASARYGELPDDDIGREKRLLRWGWLWLLIPIIGIIPYSEIRDELTDRWGHTPWWL